jgi:hypothetical protein
MCITRDRSYNQRTGDKVHGRVDPLHVDLTLRGDVALRSDCWTAFIAGRVLSAHLPTTWPLTGLTSHLAMRFLASDLHVIWPRDVVNGLQRAPPTSASIQTLSSHFGQYVLWRRSITIRPYCASNVSLFCVNCQHSVKNLKQCSSNVHVRHDVNIVRHLTIRSDNFPTIEIFLMKTVRRLHALIHTCWWHVACELSRHLKFSIASVY